VKLGIGKLSVGRRRFKPGRSRSVLKLGRLGRPGIVKLGIGRLRVGSLNANSRSIEKLGSVGRAGNEKDGIGSSRLGSLKLQLTDL